ncbi:isopentenyl phosphate kinase-like [Actinia tenebrosa]|uniref:Isopentenyl phosphate kinase n=1 Tax=Actinia tenebrosa TaxID=6105 RepID=A0A6P8IBZ9_ACTTE|nr:isopentenyl phosphate kinase-like [Actinia tenebrosa]
MSANNGVEVIIKLGGSAITYKNELEKENLVAFAKAARIAAGLKGTCIIVHGAGSFGHFQAHEYGVAKGFGCDVDHTRIGFAMTRLSVTKLNHKVTEFFVSQGIPAIGLSPCGTWLTSSGHVTTAVVDNLAKLVFAGFVPVLHGDCVLDTDQGCAILSGDKIIERLVQELQPKRVVFLTDVKGIYDRPPEEQGAVLLQQINVTKDGDISVPIATNILGHDVTDGVKGKLKSISNIVISSNGLTKVFVANILSDSAYRTCIEGCTSQGEGTEIKLAVE